MNILNELAKPYAAKLRDVVFDNEEQTFRVMSAGKQWHNVYNNNGTYVVRISIDAQSVLVGSTQRIEKAVRFADMAIVYFRPYRQRAKRELTDLDMNISLDSAYADLESNAEARALLQGMEDEWRDNGVLPQINRKEADLQARVLYQQTIQSLAVLEKYVKYNVGAPKSLTDCYLAAIKEMQTNTKSWFEDALARQPFGKIAKANRAKQVEEIAAKLVEERTQLVQAVKVNQEQRQEQVQQMGGVTEASLWADLGKQVNPNMKLK